MKKHIPLLFFLGLYPTGCNKGKMQSGEAPKTESADLEPQKGEKYGEREDESVTPPSKVTGGALYCAIISEETLPEDQASVGCQILRNGIKVEFNESSKFEWSVNSTLEFQFITLPEGSDYHVKVQIKAKSSSELESQLPQVRISALRSRILGSRDLVVASRH